MQIRFCGTFRAVVAPSRGVQDACAQELEAGITVGASFSKNVTISLRRSFLRRTTSSAAFTP